MTQTTAPADGVTSSRRPRAGYLAVAAAGYGKTTFFESLAVDRPLAVLGAADLVESDPSEWIPPSTGSVPDPQIVVEGLTELPHREQLEVARTLALLPNQVQWSVTSRCPIHSRVLAGLRRPLMYRGPADLALSTQDIARVLLTEHDVAELEIASQISELTAGWPMLVQLAGVAMRQGAAGSDLLAAIAGPGTAGAAWIQEQVLAALSEDARRTLDLAIDFDPIALPLLTAIGAADGSSLHPDQVACGFEWLTATGLLVPRESGNDRAGLRLVPVIGEVVARASRSRSQLAADRQGTGRERIGRFTAAASWYAEHGHHFAAAQAATRGGDPAAGAAAIEAHGAEMVAAGAARAVIALVESLPADDRGRPAVQLIYADALRSIGEPVAARAVFATLLRTTDGSTGLPAGLAWRIGMLHYMAGDFAAAEAECARMKPESAGLDAILAAACRAGALAALGEPVRSAEVAQWALARAMADGCDRGLAAAHSAVAYSTAGARRDEHLAEALAAAERGNDVLAQARIRTNQVDGLLRQARYPQALDLARQAVRAAERAGLPGLLITALCNAGIVLLQLGDFQDAALHFERAVRTSRRVGLNRTAMGLWGVAEVHRRCGRREQARVVFEEAVDLARERSDVQVLVPALTGLSRLLLEGPRSDLDAARALVEEAQRVAPPRLACLAQVGAGWLGLTAGDLAAAREAASEALQAARAGRRMDHLAEALELAAAVSAEPAVTRSLLLEAETIWRRAGAAPSADRLAMLVGRLPGAGGDERSAGKAAAARLALLGLKPVDPDSVESADGATAPVQIQILGGFEVLVGGRPVPFTAWRSKQARTLIKILVARRGRPVLRAELCEVLWPDSDPTRTAHRLSVLLSVVRTVLDPQHLWPVDHHLRADPLGLWLDRTHVAVDAEGLLRDAGHARQLIGEDQPAQARQILLEVDQLYRGTAFEEEPEEPWACGLREEVRAVWLRSLRDLADLSRRAGDLRQAVTILTRLLGEDPYDEDAHHALVRMLVRAGRHGEARRALDRWSEAMLDLGAPLPDPCVLGLPARPAPSGRP
ncbi:MAG TPA: BTAD domain-containing putative transcriptional regulator [Kineosporiaceae bacterium]|nr:BTAD domain-containing putative transcriptional regulator [Kineosporiaceae bacterium]